MDDPRRQRLVALMTLFDEETAADIEAVVLHRHAGRVLGLRRLVEELKEAGLHTQADELLRRVNEQMPEVVTSAAGLPGPPSMNGVPAARPSHDAPRRRGPGRPPKARGEGSTP